MSLALCLALATLLGAQRSDAKGPKLDDNGDPTPEQALARFGTIRFSHGGKWVLAVAFSPDGKTLAAVSPGELILWETATGKPLRRLAGPMHGGWSLDFSPDGKTLASLTSGSVSVWDVATGDHLYYVTPVKQARTVRFSPDGKHLAVTGDEGALVSWDVAGKKVVRQFKGHTGQVRWADWSPDGKRLASCGEDGTVRLWDTATGEEAGRFYKKGEQKVKVWTIVFSPDGSTLAGAADSPPLGELLVWDAKTGKELPADRAVPRQRYAYEDAAASPDGTLWARGHGNRVEVYQVAGNKLLSPPEDRYVAAGAVALSPDGRTLLTEEQRLVRLWDVQGRKLLHKIEGEFGNHWGDASAAAFRADGKSAVVLGQQHRLYEIDVATGKAGAPLDFDSVNSSAPHHFALSPDGSMLAQSYGSNAGGGPPRRTLYETKKGQQLKQWKEDVGISWVMAISPDSKVLAEAHDGTMTISEHLLLRDLKTGKQLRVIELPVRDNRSIGVRCLAYSPDGKTLAAGSASGSIHFLDAKTGEEKGRLEGHHGTVRGLSFSSDGKTLASLSTDNTALIWDVSKVVKDRAK
jgi:WD40 repeat protein